jgi:hypothetical protein
MKPFVLKKLRPAPPKGVARNIYERYKSEEILEIFAEHIVYEIKQEAVKASHLGKKVPRSSEFLSSFKFEVTDDLRIRVLLDYNPKWAWISKYLEGREPYKMDWLTKQNLKERKVIPFRDHKTGDIVFRRVPLTTKQAWIHPAIEKYTFIEMGVRRGLMKAYPKVVRKIMLLELSNRKKVRPRVRPNVFKQVEMRK